MSWETFADLWTLAGSAAAREFDPDGLPIWGRHPEHGWHHASESATALAEAAWTYRRADESHFLLAEFDAWLSALPPCPMKEELLRRRALAAEIVAAPGEYDRNALLRHLEFMEGRWRMDVREQALLPAARTGDAAQVQRRDAGFSSGEERAAERQPVWDRWKARATELHSKNPARSHSDICAQVGREFGVTRRAVANRVKIVGTERPRSKK